MALEPGPIALRASLHETIWGGELLRDILGKPVPPGALVGESWETALDATAINAPYAGRTLEQLVAEYGADLIGTQAVRVFGMRFPLLTKFIHANAALSVQVHPKDDYASEHEGGKLGKTECWYILHAEPGATIVYGLNRPSSREEVRQAVESVHLDSLLHTFEVHAGDVVYVPAGTVHAIGAGIVLYELQEYSDVTYRLYDYGRLQANGKPRDLHLDRALDVMKYGPQPYERVTPLTLAQSASATQRALVASRYFVLEEIRLAGMLMAATLPESCHILTVLDGSCAVQAERGEVVLAKGETAVLPATLGGYHLVSEGARLVRSYVPLPDDAALLAWRAAQAVPVED